MTKPASSTLVERLNQGARFIEQWSNTSSPQRHGAIEQEALELVPHVVAASARITELEAELLRVKSYLSDAGWETVQSEQAWKARALTAESQLERVRAETWQDIETALENSVPYMEPVLLTIRGRKLPIAVFKHNAESPWRYLESGKEIEDNIIPTHWMPLPAPPQQKTEGV